MLDFGGISVPYTMTGKAGSRTHCKQLAQTPCGANGRQRPLLSRLPPRWSRRHPALAGRCVSLISTSEHLQSSCCTAIPAKHAAACVGAAAAGGAPGEPLTVCRSPAAACGPAAAAAARAAATCLAACTATSSAAHAGKSAHNARACLNCRHLSCNLDACSIITHVWQNTPQGFICIPCI